jgi:hypothetical protein
MTTSALAMLVAALLAAPLAGEAQHGKKVYASDISGISPKRLSIQCSPRSDKE